MPGGRTATVSRVGRRTGSRTRRVAVEVLASAALLLAAGSCSEAPLPRPRNVLLISIDTLNRSALGAYDAAAPALPALDALARSSLRFDRAHSTASWTLPAHASLMTGLYPDRHGAFHRRTRIAEEVVRLSQRMRDAGLETVAFTGGVWLSPDYGFAPGFDRYDTWIDPERQWTGPDIPRGGEPSRPRGARLFDRARAYLDGRRGQDAGFFLFLHTYVVHDYWAVHPWAARRVGEDPRDEGGYLDCLKGERDCSPRTWERLRDLYAAELQRLDAGLDSLLVALERSGERDRTLILLVSDHGEGFDPGRQRIHHGGRLHEDLIRIPFLISGPGVRPGSTDHPVSLVDVLPTLTDLMGLDSDPGLDGHSVAAVLDGSAPAVPDRALFAMEQAHRWRNGRHRSLDEIPPEPLQVAVMRGDDWYIQHKKRAELYDMAADSHQTRNLAGKSSREESLRDLIRAREKLRTIGPEHELDEKRLQEIRSLGYVD